jgi:hypothetical protein
LPETKEGVIPSLPRLEEDLEFFRQHGDPVPSWIQSDSIAQV